MDGKDLEKTAITRIAQTVILALAVIVAVVWAAVGIGVPMSAIKGEAARKRQIEYVAVCGDLVIHGISKDGGVLRVGGEQIYLGDECSLLPEAVYEVTKQ